MKGRQAMSWMHTGFVAEGEQQSFDVVLEAGTSAVIYVRPKEDVSADLDLHVYDEKGDLVSHDVYADIDAACRVTPERTGPFRVVVSSARGSSRFALLMKTVGT
ncbi:MAG TPA: hypothetical protein VKP64_12820 [Mycobacteriales bacterium]|nr:hypothetical protein [Mycobacteriales bacterium]